jgi:WD40 repeat protein
MPVCSRLLFASLAAVLALVSAAPVRAAEFEKKSEVGIGSGSAYAVAFSPDGKTIAIGGGADQSVLRIWDVAARKFTADLKGPEGFVWAVAFSPDGKLLASGGADSTARVWDLATGKEIAKFPDFADRVTGVAFSPDGQTLAACSNDNTAALFDLAGKKEKFKLAKHTGQVRGVAFAPDGKSLATVGKDNQVFFWNPDTGKPRVSIKFKEILYSCAFTPDGKQLLVAGGEEFQGKDNSIKGIDTATKKAEVLFKGHTSSIWALSVAADGKTVASSGYHDETARLWDLENKTPKGVLKTGKDVFSVAISPDGQRLAVGTAGSVTLYAVKP